MLIDTLLQVSRSDIVRGLASGKYSRWGGVVRVAKGQPGAGQIVGMLREAGSIAQLANPVGAVMSGMNMVVNARGHHVTQTLVREGFAQTHKMLGQVMGISALGAGASVLNLGLSAVGFYVMNKKLNGLQHDVSALKRMTQETHVRLDNMDSKLDNITGRLVELRYLAHVHDNKLDDVLEAVFSVKNALFSQQMASLQVALQQVANLDPRHEPNAYRSYLDDIARVRLNFQGQLNGRKMRPEQDPRMFLDTLSLLRGWMVAGAAQVMIDRRRMKLDEAASTAAELGTQARDWTTRWTNELLPEEDFAGAGRFGFKRFDDTLSPHTRRRIYTAYLGEEPDIGPRRELEINGVNEVAHHLPGLTDNWFERQVELANLIDMFEESTERLESLAAETAICANECIPFEEWEALEEPDENDVREAQLLLSEEVA